MIARLASIPALALAGACFFVSSSAGAQYGSPPPPGYGQPPPGGYQQQPGYGQPPPNYPPPNNGGYNNGGYGYGDAPPPPARQSEEFDIPDFAVRVDPFNWLIAGRLGFEFEVQLWEWLTFELLPVFVVNSEPPAFNFSGREDNLSQESNGLGAMSGASFGLGFWLEGEPFEGYVLKAVLTNYGYTYKTTENDVEIDSVDHTERIFYGFFGSYSKFGPFTIGGGIGLGVELNKQERCFNRVGGNITVADSGCDGELQIKLDSAATEIGDLNGPLHPVYIEGRISLGFVFEL